jgi:DNA-binding transcriptional regulator YdaS (Cro superfamily)
MNTTKRTPKNESLERAIAHFGSLSEMARQLGVSGYQVIQQWRSSGRVPPQHCTRLAQLTGESRDDLVGWPPLEDNSAASDDVQNNAGGSVSRKRKESRMAA